MCASIYFQPLLMSADTVQVERDNSILSAGIPSWIENDNLGHGSVFSQLVDAGYLGIAGTRYMQWVSEYNLQTYMRL